MKEILKELYAERDFLAEKIIVFEEELKKSPPGRLIGRRVGGNTFLYHQYPEQGLEFEEMKKRRIGKSPEDQKLAERLKIKAILKKCLPKMKNRLKNMNRFLKNWHPIDPEAIASNLPWAYRSLTGELPEWLVLEPIENGQKTPGQKSSGNTKGSVSGSRKSKTI